MIAIIGRGRVGMALGFLAVAAPLARGGDWTRVGGDAGMTRYSPDDIAGPVQLDYAKRFYSTFSNDPSPGNYYYSSGILIRAGVAAVFSSDSPPRITGDNFGQGLPLTLFDFSSGKTTARITTPSIADWSNLPLPAGGDYIYPSGRYSLHLGENPAEIDSGHFTQTMLWGDDGRIYVRHGGDNAVTAAYAPQTNVWTRLYQLKASPTVPNYKNAFEGDANAFLQSFGNQLIYHPGDTRQTSPYVAVDISPAAFASGSPGQWKADLGPNIPALAGDDFDNGLRYGDIPKAAAVNLNGVMTGVSVISGRVVSNSSFPQQYSVQTQATDLSTGKALWTKTFPSDSGGPSGFYTSTADYWRFLASSDGTYVMYTGATTRTLRALDMATGTQKWSYTLPAGTSEPLLASNGNSLYVIGATAQMRMDVDSGKIAWSTANPFQSEYGYVSGSDPLYRPIVLTNDTAWFVDGSSLSVGDSSLIGISTSNGQIIQRIDLSALVAKKPGESLLAVNDLAASGGELAALLDIRSTADPYPSGAPGASNGIIYQDLYVFHAVPEPATVWAVFVGFLVLYRRQTLRHTALGTGERRSGGHANRFPPKAISDLA